MRPEPSPRDDATSWWLEGRGGHACLVVAGDLDLAAAPLLAEVLGWIDTPRAPTSVDLARVTFADSSGVVPLVENARRHRERGAHLLVVDAGPAVHRIFELLGVPFRPHIDVDAWDWSLRRPA
jgi:anti-anti-sigma factor